MKNANNNAKAMNNVSQKITMNETIYKNFIGAYQSSKKHQNENLTAHIEVVLNNVATANNPNNTKVFAYPFSNRFAREIMKNENLTNELRKTKTNKYSLYYTLQFIIKQYKISIVKEGVKAVNDKIAKDTKGVTETIKTKKTK